MRASSSMRNELKVNKLKKERRKSLNVLSLLGPVTTQSSIALLSDVINIDVVIRQLSGNERGEGGPRRDIRPARHVSRIHVWPTNKTDTLPVCRPGNVLTF